jgi:hypothetical protein
MSTLSTTEAFDFCSAVYKELEKQEKTTEATIDDMVKAIKEVAPQYQISTLPVDERSTLEEFSSILRLASLEKEKERLKELAALFTQLPAFGELSEKARYTARIAKELFSGKEASDLNEFIIYAMEAIGSAQLFAQKLDKSHRMPILTLLNEAYGLLEQFGDQKLEQVREKIEKAHELTNALIGPKTPSYVKNLRKNLITTSSDLDEVKKAKDPTETGSLIVKRKGYEIEKTAAT